MNINEIQELKTIIENYIPLGEVNSQCHLGICSIKHCNRCLNAIKVRELVNKIIPNELDLFLIKRVTMPDIEIYLTPSSVKEFDNFIASLLEVNK